MSVLHLAGAADQSGGNGALIAAGATIVAALLGVVGTLLARRRFWREAQLAHLESRLKPYTALWVMLAHCGTGDDAPALNTQRREALAHAMRRWYFQSDGGLLLSGSSLIRFRALREVLEEPACSDEQVAIAASRLRTSLKTDLRVRAPWEAHVQMAPSDWERASLPRRLAARLRHPSEAPTR
jgi:hypothetical protein